MKISKHSLRVMSLSLIAGAFALTTVSSCSEGVTIDDFIGVTKTSPYDPAKAVKINDFTPKQGGVGQQVVIEGENFGNDTALVKVNIGGKLATVVSVKSNALYCYVPSHAFSGVLQVTVGDDVKGIKEQTVVAGEKFTYERKMVVGTLCGHKNADDKQGWSDATAGAPFETVTGFRNDGVMKFSPYNHQQLFVVYDKEPYLDQSQHAIQLIDLEKKTVTDILRASMFNGERLRTIDFATDPFAYRENGEMVETGTVYDEELEEEVATYYADDAWLENATADQLRWREHLIVTVDAHNDQFTAPAVWIVDRDANGNFSDNSPHTLLASYNQCNGAALHPTNGEMYFNSYTRGEMLRLDMDKYWETIVPNYAGTDWDSFANQNLYDAGSGTTEGTGAFELLYKIQDNGFECQIDIHPDGKYAYIVVINKEYMLKTDYNFVTERFTAPYQVAGTMNQKGNQDGVGKSALLARPYQGTFAVNDQYKKEGRDDIYDFYFCDSGELDENNSGNVGKFGSTIRCLTPEGIVSTYAGGGANTHADGLVWGSENGELRDVARFYRPTGLVSDLTYDILDADGNPTRIFYILDTMNRQIRTIGYEHEEEGDLPETNE